MSTDQDVMDAHRDVVRSLSKPGGPLAPNSPNTTMNNPEWFIKIGASRIPTPARQALHQNILQEHLAKYPHAQQNKKAIVLAGPPGAGKSYTLEKSLGDSVDQYVKIDADDFKMELLKASLADGSYESYLVPESIKALERDGERFFPLELATLVHEESSVLAHDMRFQAIKAGYNVVIDTVLSSEKHALEMGSELQGAEYSIEIIDVEVPFALSEQRIAQRWQESYEKALKQESPEKALGGRWVPSEYARDVFDGPNNHSRPEAAAQRLATECTAVQQFRRYRTTLDEKDQPVGPTLEINQRRLSPAAPLTQVSQSVESKAVAARNFAASQVGPLRPRGTNPERAHQPTKGPKRPGPGHSQERSR